MNNPIKTQVTKTTRDHDLLTNAHLDMICCIAAEAVTAAITTTVALVCLWCHHHPRFIVPLHLYHHQLGQLQELIYDVSQALPLVVEGHCQTWGGVGIMPTKTNKNCEKFYFHNLYFISFTVYFSKVSVLI